MKALTILLLLAGLAAGAPIGAAQGQTAQSPGPPVWLLNLLPHPDDWVIFEDPVTGEMTGLGPNGLVVTWAKNDPPPIFVVGRPQGFDFPPDLIMDPEVPQGEFGGPLSQTPEPSTVTLIGAGLIGLGLLRRTR